MNPPISSGFPSLPCLMTPEGNIDAVFMVDVANVVDVCAKDPSSLVRWSRNHGDVYTFSIRAGVSRNGDIPIAGWFRREPPIKMDDLGVPLFQETIISSYRRCFGRFEVPNWHNHTWRIWKNTRFLLQSFTALLLLLLYYVGNHYEWGLSLAVFVGRVYPWGTNNSRLAAWNWSLVPVPVNRYHIPR